MSAAPSLSIAPDSFMPWTLTLLPALIPATFSLLPALIPACSRLAALRSATLAFPLMMLVQVRLVERRLVQLIQFETMLNGEFVQVRLGLELVGEDAAVGVCDLRYRAAQSPVECPLAFQTLLVLRIVRVHPLIGVLLFEVLLLNPLCRGCGDPVHRSAVSS